MTIITTATLACYQTSEIPHEMRLHTWPRLPPVTKGVGRNERMEKGNRETRGKWGEKETGKRPPAMEKEDAIKTDSRDVKEWEYRDQASRRCGSQRGQESSIQVKILPPEKETVKNMMIS